MDLPVNIFRYEVLSMPLMRNLKAQIFGMLNPEYMATDPNMLDSSGIVSQKILAMLPPEYNFAARCDSQDIFELLIHRLFGQSMQTEREPFVDESLVVNYLLDIHAPSIVLDFGKDQLPAIRGLDAVVREFDDVINTIDLDSIFGRLSYLSASNPQTKVHTLGVRMKDAVLQRIKSDKAFRERMKFLSRFQNASPFPMLYMDSYSDLQSTLVQNEEVYRLAALQDLIGIFRNVNQSIAKELGFLHYSLQNAFDFDGLQVSYGNPRDNISDAVPSCVSGLVGKIREASIVYEADPNIEIIGIRPYLNPSIPNALPKRLDQIVKAITVTAHDREADNETKLLVDGVIADDRLEHMLGVDWHPYMAIGILKYAQDKGIKRVIINAENSASHESVNQFKYFIATEVLGLREGIDFSYKIEGRTGNHVFRLEGSHLRNQIDDFPYTHLLDKDPMPEGKVRRLAKSRLYQGEAYLDAWHGWMVHVNTRRGQWNSELKARFPYVEERSTDMNPVWNLGCGPIVGMELDAVSALSILQQKYISRLKE